MDPADFGSLKNRNMITTYASTKLIFLKKECAFFFLSMNACCSRKNVSAYVLIAEKIAIKIKNRTVPLS